MMQRHAQSDWMVELFKGVRRLAAQQGYMIAVKAIAEKSPDAAVVLRGEMERLLEEASRQVERE